MTPNEQPKWEKFDSLLEDFANYSDGEFGAPAMLPQAKQDLHDYVRTLLSEQLEEIVEELQHTPATDAYGYGNVKFNARDVFALLDRKKSSLTIKQEQS